MVEEAGHSEGSYQESVSNLEPGWYEGRPIHSVITRKKQENPLRYSNICSSYWKVLHLIELIVPATLQSIEEATPLLAWCQRQWRRWPTVHWGFWVKINRREINDKLRQTKDLNTCTFTLITLFSASLNCQAKQLSTLSLGDSTWL